MSSEGGGTKELRLGVVCYGGSSLAIYMHGVTKELHRLVKASVLVEAGQAPDKGAPTEAVYAELLDAVAKENDGVRTRVVVDVVAGTSAGGINGIYLTKAIAHNLSQDALRDLWFDRGDMSQLVLLPTWLPVKLRFFLLLPRSLRKSPLRGDSMARWLFEALEGMDAGGSEPDSIETLVPEDGRLDLYVTITDFYGYDRQVPIDDPRIVHDSRHRHALAFTYVRGSRDQFKPANNGSLAFRGANDLVLPRRLPAGQHRGLPEVGAERRPRRPEALLPRLRARGRAAGEHLLRGRRRARQQAVRLGDRRDQGQEGRRRGRAEAAVPRARSR